MRKLIALVLAIAAMSCCHAQSRAAERQARSEKSDIFWNLKRIKFTHEQMMQVTLDVNWTMSGSAAEKYAQLYDALAAQWKIQTGNTLAGYQPLPTDAADEDADRLADVKLITQLQALAR